MNTKAHLVTQEHFDRMEFFRRKYDGYTPSEVQELQSLVKTYVNEHTTVCGTCTGNLGEVKKELVDWYARWKEDIYNRLNESVAPIEEAPKVEEKPLDTIIEKKNTHNKKRKRR